MGSLGFAHLSEDIIGRSRVWRRWLLSPTTSPPQPTPTATQVKGPGMRPGPTAPRVEEGSVTRAWAKPGHSVTHPEHGPLPGI